MCSSKCVEGEKERDGYVNKLPTNRQQVCSEEETRWLNNSASLSKFYRHIQQVHEECGQGRPDTRILPLQNEVQEVLEIHFLFPLWCFYNKSYILHTESHPAATLKSKAFRLQLAKELIGQYNTKKERGKPRLSISRLPLTHYPVRDEEIGSRHKRGRCLLKLLTKPESPDNLVLSRVWSLALSQRTSQRWLFSAVAHKTYTLNNTFTYYILHIILFTDNRMRLKKLKPLKTKVTM